MKRSTNILKQLALEGLRQQLDTMVPRVKQVMKQTRARIFRDNTRCRRKNPQSVRASTEVIRKGKAAKPNEFGKMVKLQEAENQIVTDYEIYDRRPNDSDLLIAAIDAHQARLGRTPRLVAADAAFYSTKNEAAAKARASNASASQIAPPKARSANASRRSAGSARPEMADRMRGSHQRGQATHGLDRCRYKGDAGMKRWVGLGVIADNLVKSVAQSKSQAGTVELTLTTYARHSTRRGDPTGFAWPRSLDQKS